MIKFRNYATDIASITRDKLRLAQAPRNAMRKPITIRMPEKPTDKSKEDPKLIAENAQFPRKVFSGIQPTGALHLGNYLGAVRKWTDLQNERQKVTYCIVDMHSITLPQSPDLLRENILQMAATMFGCGIDPDLSTVFVQSAVKEHSELCWILGCLSTMARLGHLPQYKEKTRVMKDIPLGLFVYPVLQAADILLYKTTHVPVGEDQVQHIQLAQQLAKNFNTYYGSTFPICHAVIEDKHAARIRSLREPAKKMSKSDADTRATIHITDEPEVIVDKIKKAVTDFTSDITFDPELRPGVSNLVSIYSLVTGKTPKQICEEATTLNTGQFKLRVADAVVEHFKPIRIKINKHLSKRLDLVHLLEKGAEKARLCASETMQEVKQKMGLGGQFSPAYREFRTEMLMENQANEATSTVNTKPKEDIQVESAEIIKETIFKVAPPVEIKNKESSSIILTKDSKEIKKDKFSLGISSKSTITDADADAKKLIQEIKIVQS